MTFGEIIGHERAKETLQGSIAQDSVHHAYLVIGPRGVGKTLLGTTFAAALTCHTPADGEPCGQCPSCNQLSQGAQPNVRILGDGEGKIAVDAIRELVRWIGLRTIGGGHRVVLIRGAETMNESAANALLKTLEEPPPKTTFILTTSALHSLLPTIRSRCQAVPLSPLPVESVARYLEDQGKDPKTALGLALLSGGAIGQAIALTDDALETRTQILKRILACDGAPISGLFKDAEADGKEKEWLKEMLPILESFLRDALVLKLSPESPLVNRDYRDEIAQWSSTRSPGDIHGRLKDLTRARKELRLNIIGRVVLERLYLGLRGHGASPKRPSQ